MKKLLMTLFVTSLLAVMATAQFMPRGAKERPSLAGILSGKLEDGYTILLFQGNKSQKFLTGFKPAQDKDKIGFWITTRSETPLVGQDTIKHVNGYVQHHVDLSFTSVVICQPEAAPQVFLRLDEVWGNHTPLGSMPVKKTYVFSPRGMQTILGDENPALHHGFVVTCAVTIPPRVRY